MAEYPLFTPPSYPSLYAIQGVTNSYIVYISTGLFMYLTNPTQLLAQITEDTVSQDNSSITGDILLKAIAIAQDPKLALELCK